MEPFIQAFKLPKKGNSLEEYEDALEFALEQNRFAIADGATESSYSDRWARSLVKQYILDPPFGIPPSEDALQLWLLPQQEEWRAGINWETLPWFAEEKAKSGAFAAFLGLEFASAGTLWQRILAKAMPGEELVWNAFAVGDCCLFQVRRDDLLVAFPLDKSEQFSSRPFLLASNPINNQSALKEMKHLDGHCRPGDRFFLASDALAKWMLAQTEAGTPPWTTLEALQTEEEFTTLVDGLRASGALRNDDTTLAVLRWQ